MRLEAMATPSESYVPLELVDENGLLQTKWLSLIRVIMDDTLSVTDRASLFHASLAQMIVQQARAIREKHGINIVTLSGGVFQNSVLTEQAITLLSKDNFVVHLPSMIPVNDAGISFGQVMEFGFHQKT
jgi:hydrogenase maturation protein HypF